jgi:hypothetical protein
MLARFQRQQIYQAAAASCFQLGDAAPGHFVGDAFGEAFS